MNDKHNSSVWIALACLIAAIFIFMAIGCGAPQNAKIIHEHKPIQRVMMHERGHYTVFVMDEDGVMTEVEVNYPTLKVDAAQGDPMMLETIRDGWGAKYVIHLHKPDEINGAGWSRTNDETTEKGQTTVIE